MTFIGIRCERNFAEIVTDTVSYSEMGAKFAEVSKVDTFPHLDAAFTSSGHGKFCYFAHRLAHKASISEQTFDDMVEAAPEWLRIALEASGEDPAKPTGDEVGATMFLVGYSAREKGFAAYMATMQDFEPKRLTEPRVQPSPLNRYPNQDEIDWVRELVDVDENVTAEQVEVLIGAWTAKPSVSVKGDADWIKLAQASRATRSLKGDFARVWVAGSLFITRMKVGSIRTNKLLTFNDTGDELHQLLTESHHPLAQISACGWCDSGQPALDCCLKDDLDDPCACDSGKTFRDCCMVTDRDAVRERLWTEH